MTDKKSAKSDIKTYAKEEHFNGEFEIMASIAIKMATFWLKQGETFLKLMDGIKSSLPFTDGEVEESLSDKDKKWINKLWIKTSELVNTLDIGDELEQIYQEALNSSVSSIDLDFSIPDSITYDYPKERMTELLREINETTHSEIRNIIDDLIKNKSSYATAASTIAKRFEDYAVPMPQGHIRNRATLVAVTEARIAYTSAQWDLADYLHGEGIPMVKSWSTVGDDKVSDGCQDNEDAEWIPYDEEFPSGDQRPPRFPGCRCDLFTEPYNPDYHGVIYDLEGEYRRFYGED